MNTFSISDISNSKDRYKLFVLMCSQNDISNGITYIRSQKLKAVNIGQELAVYIDKLKDFSYIDIDIADYFKKLLENNKSKINNYGNDVVAIYNLGILFESSFKLNVVQLLTTFSKSTAIIILWENEIDFQDKLSWHTQKDKIFLDFSEAKLKKFQYEI